MIGIELPVSRTRFVANDDSASNRTRTAVTFLDHRFVGEHVPLIVRSTEAGTSFSPEAGDDTSISSQPLLRTRMLFVFKALACCADDFAVSGTILPSLPFVFSRVGIIPGGILITLGGVLSASILASSGNEPPIPTTREQSNQVIAGVTVASLARISVSMFHLGILVADQVLLRDITASLVNRLDAHSALLALIFLLSASFWLRAGQSTDAASLTQHAESLRRVMGTISIFLLCLILSLRAYQRIQLPHAHQHVQWVVAEGPSQFGLDLLLTFPIVLICFTAALAPELLSARQQRGVPTLQQRIALFCFVGISGYVLAGRETLDNIWLNFPPNDALARFGKILYCGFLWLSIPHICRQGVPSTIAASSAASSSAMTAEACEHQCSYCAAEHSPEGEAMSEDERNRTQLRSSLSPSADPITITPAIYPLLLLFVSFLIALFVRHVAAVWGLFGSTIGVLLCFIISTHHTMQALLAR